MELTTTRAYVILDTLDATVPLTMTIVVLLLVFMVSRGLNLKQKKESYSPVYAMGYTLWSMMMAITWIKGLFFCCCFVLFRFFFFGLFIDWLSDLLFIYFFYYYYYFFFIGKCIDYTGTYRCSCDPGYSGRNCTTDIDECESSPCHHGE